MPVVTLPGLDDQPHSCRECFGCLLSRAHVESLLFLFITHISSEVKRRLSLSVKQAGGWERGVAWEEIAGDKVVSRFQSIPSRLWRSACLEIVFLPDKDGLERYRPATVRRRMLLPDSRRTGGAVALASRVPVARVVKVFFAKCFLRLLLFSASLRIWFGESPPPGLRNQVGVASWNSPGPSWIDNWMKRWLFIVTS